MITGKRAVSVLTSILAVVFLLVGTSCGSGGSEKLLMLTFVEVGDEDVSEVEQAQAVLEHGGHIYINVGLVRKIDPRFDENFVHSNSQGNFIVVGTVLNWISSRGWHYRSSGLPGRTYVFVK